MSLLKIVGQGLLYIVLSPFVVLYVLGYFLYLIGVSLVYTVKSILLFFIGKNIKDKDKETRMLEKAMAEDNRGGNVNA